MQLPTGATQSANLDAANATHQPKHPISGKSVRTATSSDAVAAERWPGALIGNSTSWLFSALAVGLMNAPQLAERLSPTLRVFTRLQVQLYDLAFFLSLGCCGAIGSEFLARWRRWQRVAERSLINALVTLGLGAAIGALVMAQDLGGFVARNHLRVKPETLGAAIGAGAFATLLGVRWFARGWLSRWIALLVGAVAAYFNAEFLPGDYRGTHFLVTLSATMLLVVALRGVFRMLSASRVLAGAAVLMALGLFVPPRDSVRQGLWASSGSSVFPLFSDWVAIPRHVAKTNHPIVNAEWFSDRSQRSAIPPSGATILPSRPAVLLLTIEALRSDVLERPVLAQELPTLARIRDRSLWFRNARTPSPATVVTVTSLMSGKYYSQIYFNETAPGAADPVHDRSIRVPELLAQHGVESTFVVAYRSLLAKYGVGRGFTKEISTEKNYGPAPEVMRHVLAELEHYRTGHSPLFLFAHFIDSHAPYNQAGEKATPFEGYLAELGLIDRELARLLRYLESRGMSDRVLLVIGADHGEAFGEHGMNFHGKNIYEELMRIPLMFVAPSIRAGQNQQPVTSLDLAPTLLDLFGVDTPGSFMGQSLVPILEGKLVQLRRPIAVDSGRRKQALYFDDGIKVILDLPAHLVEVYDLTSDPKELRNLIDDPTRDLTPYIAATEQFFRAHELKLKDWKPPWRRS